MKNFFFPVLLWVLTVSHSFAQKTFAPSLKPYADNWSYTLKRIFNHAGFELPAAAVTKVDSRSPLQLDSTKTFFEYGLNAPGDSSPVFRTIYKYPFPDVKIEVNYQFDNGEWQKLNRTTFVSDNQERLVEVFAEVYDAEAEAYRLDSRLEMFPHGNSQELVDSFLTYLWDSTIMNWHIILAVRNTFDAQDRLAESVSSLDYFGDPLIFRELYFYDANGDNYLIDELAVVGDDEFPSRRTGNAFADHLLIEASDSISDGLGFYPNKRTNYAYTTFGALRLIMNFDWNVATSNWKMTQRIEYKFDDEQRVASRETTIDPTSAAERELVTYAYVEDENLALEMTFHFDDDIFDWILDTKKFYYYNGLVSADPEPQQPVQALQMSPNPTVDVIRLELDAEAVVQVFNAAGQLMQSRLVQPGQILDLTALPAGIYQVTARQGAGFYSGKIVKQ